MAGVKIRGNQLITWGAGEAGNTFGKVQSASRKQTSDKVELLDENGEVFCTIYFNEKGQLEITVIFQSNVVLPAISDSVTICGVIGAYVDDFDLNWQNTQAKQYTLRATKYALF